MQYDVLYHFNKSIQNSRKKRIIDNNTDFPLHFLIYIVINDLENNLKRYPLDKYRLNIFTQIYLVPRSDQKQLETISTKIEAKNIITHTSRGVFQFFDDR